SEYLKGLLNPFLGVASPPPVLVPALYLFSSTAA
ncbi:unnamed protein product, partial [Oikopleura dioica]